MTLLDINNYIVVPSFIQKSEAERLAQWMYEQERDGKLSKDDRWYTHKFYGYKISNPLPFIKILVEKIPQVSELCGAQVLPTYVYSVIYKNKAQLTRHTDRDACEISFTVNLQKDRDWPICVKKPNGEEVCVELNPGEALMYKGCVAEHWRPGEYTGQNFVQTFMHYVKADGPNAYTFFDKEGRN